MNEDAVYRLTLAQRFLILVTVMLSNTIYSGSVLISSALLPHLERAVVHRRHLHVWGLQLA